MPRPRKTPPPVTANSVIASAAQVTSRRKQGRPPGAGVAPWQNEAWRMLDTVGELEFYREWISNALSRVRLYATETVNGETVRVDTGPAAEVLSVLFGGENGQSQMLAHLGGLLSIPGEAWLVGIIEPSTDPYAPDQWRVLARDEIQEQGTSWVIERGDMTPEKYEDGSNENRPAEALVIRLWRPHPRKWVEATSSVRSALPILRELEGLTKHVAASIDSRLAGAGVLFVPQELTFATPGEMEAPEDPNSDPFMEALTQSMITPIGDRGHASAVVPIVGKVPAQFLEKIQHVTFDSPLSEKALELRREALGRLATSLDVPAEVLQGMADVNHWTGWLLDENAIKMHVEPLVELICNGLVSRYLWPALAGWANEFDPELRRYGIEGDTSDLRQRPNRSAEAQALHASMVITDAALARETGFETDDLLEPTSEEFKRRMLMKTAGGVTTADLTAAALAQLGVTIVPKASEVQTAPGTTPAAELPAAEPPPAVEQRNPPEQMTALLVGSEAVVLRAVERAWNRASNRSRREREPIADDVIDAALRDAWGYLPRVAALCGVDHGRLHHAVDTYTRTLLSSGDQHDPVVFATVVARVLTPEPGALGG